MDFEITFRGIILFGFEIRFYSVLILSGLLAGIFLAQSEARRLGDEPAHAVNIAMLGSVFGLLGARLYHVVDEWSFYSSNPGHIFALRSGGIGIFGAILGAAFAVIVYVWWVNQRSRRNQGQHMAMLRWFDIGAPAFLLGQAVGRWGNFFNQELFGPPTELPWGIPIDAARRPAEYLANTHFHPLFLYESALSFAGVLVLLWVGRRFATRLKQGDILLLYFIWYPLERSVLELLRSDNWKLGVIPVAHLVSLVMIAGAVVALVLWRSRPPYLGPSTTTRSAHQDDEDTAVSQSRSSQRRVRRRV